MKPHLTKVSLALLSTVFLLGCQEQGSSPVGPEGLGPGFDKKDSGTCTTPVNGHCHGDDGDTGGDNPGSQTYDITFAIDGDITTDPTTVNTGPGRENSQGGQVGFDACCGGGKLILTSALLVDVAGGAQTCFGVGDLTLDDFIGTFYPDKKDMNEVEARFLFDANDRDGNPGVRYKLTLTGTAVTSMLGRGAGRFPRNIRLLCTQVWPVVYQVVALSKGDPVSVWSLTKAEAVKRLPNHAGMQARAKDFHSALIRFYPNEESLEDAHALVENGIAFLAEAREWWKQGGD